MNEQELQEIYDDATEGMFSGVMVHMLVNEVRSLRAKLDAVPVEELRFWWDPFRRGLTAEAINEAGVTIEAWLKTQEGA